MPVAVSMGVAEFLGLVQSFLLAADPIAFDELLNGLHAIAVMQVFAIEYAFGGEIDIGDISAISFFV